MRTTSSDIWDLIRGLSGPEQRYCRIELGKAGIPASWWKVWEFGLGSEGDEDVLLVNHPTFFANRVALSKAKAGLYDFLLSVLLQYSASTMPQMEAYSLMNQCQLLFDRGLVRPCMRRLDKVEVLMERFEIDELLLPFSRLKLKCMIEVAQMKEFESIHAKMGPQFTAIRQRMQERLDLLEVSPRWFLRLRKAIVGKEPITDEIAQILLPQSQEDEWPVFRSSLAESNYLAFQGMAYSLLKQREKALETRLRLHTLLEQNTHQRFLQFPQYTSNLHNIIVSYILLNQMAELEPYLSLQENIPALFASYPKKNLLNRVAFQAFSSRLLICVKVGKMEQALALLEGYHFPDPDDVPANERDQMEVNRYYAALVYYHFDRLKQAAEALNWYFASLRPESRKLLQSLAKILEAAVHWQLGNWDFLEYQLQNALRLFSEEQYANSFEKAFLKTLQKALEAPGNGDSLLAELARNPPAPPMETEFWKIWMAKLENI